MQDIIVRGVTVFFNLLNILIFIRVILSWFPVNPSGGLMGILRMLTDPILLPIRGMLSKSPLGGRGMMIDFSPLIALFLLQIIQEIILGVIVMI